MKPLLQSILDELRSLIRRHEGSFAETVLLDLDEAIERSAKPIQTAYQWLKIYKSLSY